MNTKYLFSFLLLFCSLSLFAQRDSVLSNANPLLKPFYHGVASGDPLADRVIIWTRVTPQRDTTITVTWKMATDVDMTNEVATGEVTTDASRDYTVKVDVDGLSPEQTYFYQFSIADATSLIGRTRTAPQGSTDHLRFGVVSCSNFEHGYFNAYRRLSERADLDAIIHLGDYFYEYGPGTYGSDIEDRKNDPAHEIVELADYRTRYSQYRLDRDLRAVHQQHPFLCIWDDHEIANDAYVSGAQNHNPDNEYTPGKTEGDWEVRKSTARQAYLEWMPIREGDLTIRRFAPYGDLAEIYLLDTRIEGREEQPTTVIEAESTYRTMLGDDQRNWLFDELKSSTATWKIVANQVIFSPLSVGFAAGFSDGVPDVTNIDSINAVESIFLDIWDGYPQERKRILDTIAANDIDNIVILSGDFHSAFGFDVTATPAIYPNPVALNLPTPSPLYDPESGAGSLAVEFVTPSITSANFDENIGPAAAAQFETSMNGDIPTGNPALPTVNYNPHMKFTDLDRHGYFILDLRTDKAQADWFFVESKLDVANNNQQFAQGLFTSLNENHLNPAADTALGKANQPPLAPKEIFSSIANLQPEVVVLGIHPNPLTDTATIQFSLDKAADMKFYVVDMKGQLVQEIQSVTSYESGVHRLSFNSTLAAGNYSLVVESGAAAISTVKFTVVR